MKKYLGKILTERGKYGTGYEQGSKKVLSEDQTPNRERIGLGRYRTNDWSSSALQQIIKRSVGKNWNKIHGEIRASLNFSNKQQQNAYTYGLKRHICQQVREIDTVDGVKVPLDTKGDAVWNKHWVHPTSGQIMKPAIRATPKRVKVPKYIHIGDKSYRICFSEKDTEGHWYEVDLVPIPLQDPTIDFRRQVWSRWTMPKADAANDPLPVFDMVLGAQIDSLQEAYNTHGIFAYAKSKRQLNGKEIKKLGLSDKFAGDIKKITGD